MMFYQLCDVCEKFVVNIEKKKKTSTVICGGFNWIAVEKKKYWILGEIVYKYVGTCKQKVFIVTLTRLRSLNAIFMYEFHIPIRSVWLKIT